MTRRLIQKSLVGLAIMLVLLFVPAGTLDWPAAWVFLIEFGQYWMHRLMHNWTPFWQRA